MSRLPGAVRWSLIAVAAVIVALLGAGFILSRSEDAQKAPSVAWYGPMTSTSKEVASDAPVTIAFDRQVIPSTAESALHIDPPVDGTISWKGNSMTFTPRTGWARGTSYRVSLDQNVRSLFLQNLAEPVAFEFMTAKELAVLNVQPSDGATEVAAAGTIAVQLSYPAVALGTTGGAPNPLKIEPALPGKGRWLTTSLYLYQPEGGFASGVNYKVTVPKGFKDAGGSALAADYQWSFTTKAPSVGKVSPDVDTKNAGPTQEVRVSFDQPVDHPSAEQRFTLKGSDGTQVPGTFKWDGDVLVFAPGAQLKPLSAYSATVGAGVKAARGGGETKAFSWSFTTVGPPEVVSTAPKDKETRQLAGSVQIAFTNPMDHDSVQKSLTIDPKPSEQHLGWQESDTRMFVWGGMKPSTRYTVTLGADATDSFGQRLGEPFSFSFTTAPLPASVTAAMPDFIGTFNASTSPVLFVEHTNISSIDFALQRLDRSTFMRLSLDYNVRKNFAMDDTAIVRRWTEKPSSTQRDEALLTSTSLAATRGGKLSPGYYFLRVRCPEGPTDNRLLVISRLGLTMKRADGQLLVWATDLTSGDPVPNLPIRITDKDGRTMANGKTDKDGVVLATKVPMFNESRQMIPLFAIAEGDGDQGVVGSQWMEGIAPYDFRIPWQTMPQQYRGQMYTDRPIYRPGQKVLFRGILRSDSDGNYTLPAPGTELTLQAMDSRGRKILADKVKVSDMGTFDGELPLSMDTPTGYYHLSAAVGNWSFGAEFSVAEYRKPEFEVKVSSDKNSYVQGDRLSATATASYYFGQPLDKSKVQWQVTSHNYFFSLPEDGYQFVDSDLLRADTFEGDRVRTEGKGTLDSQGNFNFQLPADLSKDSTSQWFTLEATVTDANNQEVSARTEVAVHKGDYYVGLRPEKYVAKAGDPATVELLAVDKDKKPVPGAQLTVSFYNRKWNSVKEKQPDGSFFWTSKPEDTLIGTQKVTAGPDGKGRASVNTKDPGSVRVVGEITDGKGNTVRSATYLYVTGSSFAAWRIENNDRVDLVLDKKEYNVGDTAKVLIPSPVAEATALVTVERGKVLSYKLMKLKGNSETLELPVVGDYLPNVFVSAVVMKGSAGNSGIPAFKVGYGELKVATTSKALKVAITPDKPRYQPGEKATFAIKTTDAAGKGVPAELSVAVVDASVLALAGDLSEDLMQSFWGKRMLGVGTSSTLSLSIDRHNADVGTENKGAGDGSDGVEIRKEFPDTAFWDARVRTSSNGDATVTVNVPDSLTTWRVTARGVTTGTLVGSATVNTIATKSLLLRPALPRFLLMGDKLKLATLLHNYTDKEAEVEVSLAAKGVRPDGGSGFSSQKVKVPAGGMQKLEWPATVDTVPGAGAQATITLSAKPTDAGIPGDSVEIKLPVNPLTTAEVVSTAGEVRDSTMEKVLVPEGANPALGELTVETSPSLAAGMRYSARFLDDFPYECTEQTISRFLPRVVMQRAFDKAGLPDREGIAAKLGPLVAKSLQKLYAGQRPDGGWGWWPGDTSDQWITAYVVQGMAEARRSGHTVDQGVLDKASLFLARSLDSVADASHPENPNGRAFVLYSMALAGKGDLGSTNALYDRRSILANYGKAYLLMALKELGGGSQDGKTKGLASELSSAAISSASGSHWEESQADYRTMNTNTRSSAVVLDALVRAAPDNPTVQPAVRWLMVARKDGHWETTQETAVSLLALTDYLLASDELKADYAYQVSLNGKELATETAGKANLDESKKLVVEVKNLLTTVDNNVVISRSAPGTGGVSGDGKLYYTMQLRYFLPSEKAPAMSQGVALVREYFKLGDEGAGPIAQVKAGDTVKVKLTMVAMQDLHYLAIEDPLPSGLEPVDTRLKTTSVMAKSETGLQKEQPAVKGAAPTRMDPPWWRYDYFRHVEPRDDRVALFATYLPKGTYEYTYLARATSSGDFQVLPARGYEMYFPEVWGRSEGGKLTVNGQ